MNSTTCECVQLTCLQLTGGNKPADCDPIWNAIQAEALQHAESEQLLRATLQRLVIDQRTWPPPLDLCLASGCRETMPSSLQKS